MPARGIRAEIPSPVIRKDIPPSGDTGGDSFSEHKRVLSISAGPFLSPVSCTYLPQKCHPHQQDLPRNAVLPAVHTRYVHENGLLRHSSCTYLPGNTAPHTVHTRYVHENGLLRHSGCTYLPGNTATHAVHTRHVHENALLRHSGCTYLPGNTVRPAVHTRYVHENALLRHSSCTYLPGNAAPHAVHTRYVHENSLLRHSSCSYLPGNAVLTTHELVWIERFGEGPLGIWERCLFLPGTFLTETQPEWPGTPIQWGRSCPQKQTFPIRDSNLPHF